MKSHPPDARAIVAARKKEMEKEFIEEAKWRRNRKFTVLSAFLNEPGSAFSAESIIPTHTYIKYTQQG